MRLNGNGTGRHALRLAALAAFFTLAFAIFAPRAGAQTNAAGLQLSEARPTPPPETIQTIFLSNAVEENDLNSIATDLRNALPRAKIFPDQSQNAIIVRATQEDLAAAQKLIADLDRPRKVYRLTFTTTDIEDGKRIASQHYVFLAVAGERTIFKQGSKVPIVTGTQNKQTAAESTEIQYLDIGLTIDATMTGSPENLMLRSKIEQSSLAGEKTAAVAPDPIFQQTVLQGASELAQGKPAILGSLDFPGTTRRQEIEVVAEPVH